MKNHGPPGFSMGFPHMLPCYQASQRHSLIFSFLITLSLRVRPALRVSALQIWQLPSAGTATGKSPLSRSKLKKRCLFSRMRKRSCREASTAPSESSLSFEICLRSLAIRWDCLLLKASEAFSHRSSSCSLENAGRQWFSKWKSCDRTFS